MLSNSLVTDRRTFLAGCATFLAGCGATTDDEPADSPTQTTVADLDCQRDPPWPSVRHDAANTGYAADVTGPATAPEPTPHPTIASPAGWVVGEHGIFGTSQPRISSFSPSGEVERWFHKRRGGSRRGNTLTLGCSDLFVQSNDGLLRIDPDNGSKPWQKQTFDAAALRTDPVTDGNALVVGVDEDVAVLDTGNGETRWRTSVGDGASPEGLALDDDRVYVSVRRRNGPHTTLALSRDDGEQVWEQSGLTSWDAPAVDGDRVVCTDEDGTLLVLDATSGEVTQRLSVVDGTPLGPPSVRDGTAFVTTAGLRGVVAVDLADATVVWEQPSTNATAAPAIGSDRIYVGGEGLWAFSPDDGTVVWSHSETKIESPLSLGHGRLYATGQVTAERNGLLVFAEESA
ncbi:PQQ-binding-like beta-propeller repeat protein [Haloarchaeobius sp. DFWS5]|uniref:outer membrane protein assembly factor BamB family protein n=1 Tax=Haloarchaeobius sp. DFWS5 TaxID=3446114 RepID=UPI003EBD37D5